MNGKQNVAVVVGVAAIVLLVLFPPWYDTYELGHVRLRWIASDPVVVEEVPEQVAYFHEYTSKYSRRGEVPEPELRHETRVKQVHHEYAVSYGLAAGAMLAALALTLAAVVVLKERRGGG